MENSYSVKLVMQWRVPVDQEQDGNAKKDMHMAFIVVKVNKQL